MQGIYNYIPERNNISGVYLQLFILSSQFVVQFPMIKVTIIIIITLKRLSVICQLEGSDILLFTFLYSLLELTVQVYAHLNQF
jgi:hypothetical protein